MKHQTRKLHPPENRENRKEGLGSFVSEIVLTDTEKAMDLLGGYDSVTIHFWPENQMTVLHKHQKTPYEAGKCAAPLEAQQFIFER